MKKWNDLLKARYYLAGIILSLFLLPISSTTLGDIGQSSFKNPAIDCRLAPNPDQCYRDQRNVQPTSSDPTSLIPTSFSTNTLGMEGPFQGEVKYDTDLSWIFGLKYLQLFGESVAIGTQLTAGPREMRANLTTGYALTKNQRVKLTYEYLTQNLPFDFATGSIREWVKQHSVGAAYEYVFQHEILHSLELSGYATRAKSKELSDVAFNQQTIVPGQDYIYDVNYRRIAGGKENTALASFNLYPFADTKTSLTLGGGYSTVKYDTLYETDSSYNSNQGIAYKAELNHILSPKLKLNTTINSTAASREHSVQLNRILPGKIEAGVKGQYTKGQAGLPDNKSITLGLTYPAPASYETARFTSSAQELKEWVDKPVIYSNRVLAIKDEMVVQYEFKKGATIPDQVKYFHDYLNPVATVNYFYFDEPSIQVNYTVYIQRLTVNGKPVSNSSGKDYTKDLNLGLVVDGPNQVVLKSASNDGIPEKDSTGETTLGDYQVTITANGSVNGLAPMTVSNNFKLTVQGGDISWKDKTVPDANMGYTYLDGPTKVPVSEVDLNQKITFSEGGRDTAANITLESDKPFPSWLKLDTCKGNSDHQCLMTNGTELPNNADIKDFNVYVVAKGNQTGSAANAELNAKVFTQLPEWLLNPTAEVQEGQATTISLPQYIDKGLKGLNFTEGQDFDKQCWNLSSDKSELSFVGSTIPQCLANPQVPLKAGNVTSYPSTPSVLGTLAIKVKTFNVQWVKETTKLGVDPAAGLRSYIYHLNTQDRDPKNEPGALVQTTAPDGSARPDDRYAFTLASPNPPEGWSLDQTGSNLIYSGSPLNAGDIAITLSAVSKNASPNRPAIGGNSGKGGIENTYTISVQGPAAGIQWQKFTPLDAKMGYPYLNEYPTEQDISTYVKLSGPATGVTIEMGSHPYWIETRACKANKDHICIVGNTKPVPKGKDCNFKLTFTATRQDDGQSASITVSGKIITVAPKWVPKPAPIVLDKNVPTTFPLNAYITKETSKGLSFSPQSKGFDSNCWVLQAVAGGDPNKKTLLTFKGEGKGCVIKNKTEVNVPLNALNDTSVISKAGTVPVKFSNYNVIWTENKPFQNPVGGSTTYTYGPLNNHQKNYPLVQTINHGGNPQKGDTYTFKIEKAVGGPNPSKWQIVGDKLKYVGSAYDKFQPGQQISIILSAVSNNKQSAGQSARKGRGVPNDDTKNVYLLTVGKGAMKPWWDVKGLLDSI